MIEYFIMEISRQQKWQYNKQKQGLCSWCGKKPLSKKSKWYCELCLEKKRHNAKMIKLSKLF